MTSDANALAALGRYIAEFRQDATQLHSHEIGGRWWRLRVPAAQAAEWANLGYLPEEAAPLVAAGKTPTGVAAEEAVDR